MLLLLYSEQTGCRPDTAFRCFLMQMAPAGGMYKLYGCAGLHSRLQPRYCSI